MDDETISRIVTEISDLRETHHTENPQPLSEQSLTSLQTLLNHSQPLDPLYDAVSPSHLIPPIATAMDSSPPPHSLLASHVFLSFLLSPNAPVFTLFTPLSFLSFLRSLRRAFKNTNPNPNNNAQQIRKRRRNSKNKKNVQNDDDEPNSPNSVQKVDVRVLISLFEKLVSVMGLIHLDRFPESLKSLIQTISEVPLTAIESCNEVQYGRLVGLCSKILKEVLKPEHGEVSETAAEVLKAISPFVVMPKSQVRSFAVGFVVSLSRDSDGVRKALVNFPRYLAIKVPDKAEPRALAVDFIMEVVRVMEVGDQVEFVKYVVKMSQGKTNLRLLAVDLILNLVTLLKDPLGVNSTDEEEGNVAWGIWCLEALVKRCSDVSATIRGRALSTLAQVVGFLSGSEKASVVLKEFMGFGDGNVAGVGGKGINEMLRRRCVDEKAVVRKAALLFVTNLTALLGGAIDEVVLKTMGMACSDSLLSIRKAAASALSEVLLLPFFHEVFVVLCFVERQKCKLMQNAKFCIFGSRKPMLYSS